MEDLYHVGATFRERAALPKGWVCPKCEAALSPHTPACPRCGVGKPQRATKGVVPAESGFAWKDGTK